MMLMAQFPIQTALEICHGTHYELTLNAARTKNTKARKGKNTKYRTKNINNNNNI